MSPMAQVTCLSAAFVMQHLIQSHPPVRQAQKRLLGERGFQLWYTIVSTAIWAPLVYIWWTHRHSGPLLWNLPWPIRPGLPDLASALGVVLLIAGALTSAPSSITFNRAKPLRVTGVLAITRHPVLMGATLWCIGHALANPWQIDVIFFGGQALVGVTGSLHQDWRHRTMRPEYAEFASKTSIVPSIARLDQVGRKGWIIMAAGLAFAAIARWAHRLF